MQNKRAKRGVQIKRIHQPHAHPSGIAEEALALIEELTAAGEEVPERLWNIAEQGEDGDDRDDLDVDIDDPRNEGRYTCYVPRRLLADRDPRFAVHLLLRL